MQHVYVFKHDIETFIQSAKIYVPGTYVIGVRYIIYLCAWLMPLPYCSSTSVPCVCIAVSMGTACSFQVPGDFGGIPLLNIHFG